MSTENTLVVVGVAAAASAGISYASSRYLSVKFVSIGITGNDIHKPGRPVTAEMGGLAVVIALIIGSSILIVGMDDPSGPFLAGLGTVVGASLVGAADDITNMRQRYKPFLMALTAVPLVYVLWERTSIPVPGLGALPLGIVYPLAIVPVAIAISANFSNMLAGFNGLEAGCASIALGALSFLAALKGSDDAAALGFILLCGFAGFLTLNWYPSKIFPGDTGTLMAGAGIAAVALLSGTEFAAIIVSIPAGIDFTLKMVAKRPFSGRRSFGNTTVDGQGRLRPPAYPALVHAFMRTDSLTERGLVLSVLGMQAVYAALAIALTLLGEAIFR